MQRLGFLLLFSLMSTSAAAIPFTWVATGTVYSFRNLDGELPFAEPAADAPFTYEFTYDPAGRVDQNPSPLYGTYVGGLIAASLTLGGQTLQLAVPSTAYTQVDVGVNPSTLSFYTTTTAEPAPHSLQFALQWDGLGNSGTPDTLPTTPPTMLGNPWFYLFSFDRYLNNHEDIYETIFTGAITSVTAKGSAVPEPALLALFALGLSGIFIGRQRIWKTLR